MIEPLKIHKIKNIFLTAFGIGILTLIYFLTPTVDKIKQLQSSVAPTAYIYNNPKDLNNKLNFINDKKQVVSLPDIVKNKWVLLYFGYATCPDICPIDLAILNQATQQMYHSQEIQVVFISVDPKRDIGKLTNFVTKFNNNFIGLSASKKNLKTLTKTLGVYHEITQIQQTANQDHSQMNHDKTSQTSYLVNHTASFLLLNPQFQLVSLLTNPHYPKKITEALDLIIKSGYFKQI